MEVGAGVAVGAGSADGEPVTGVAVGAAVTLVSVGAGDCGYNKKESPRTKAELHMAVIERLNFMECSSFAFFTTILYPTKKIEENQLFLLDQLWLIGYNISIASVAQWIEQWFPEPC